MTMNEWRVICDNCRKVLEVDESKVELYNFGKVQPSLHFCYDCPECYHCIILMQIHRELAEKLMTEYFKKDTQ